MSAISRSTSALLLSVALSCFPLLKANAAEQAALSQVARDAGPAYIHALQRAAQAYAQRDFSSALDNLDIADKIQADVPDTWNMRGAIYAEQHAYEKAGDAFEHAATLEPGNFWPGYNIAQLLFVQKKYADAEQAFEKLQGNAEQRELIQFKLVLLDLIQGKPDKAKAVLDSMKEPSDTAAYYFAHAAWEFSQGNRKEGQGWVESGIKIFGDKTYSFYQSLADMGWVEKKAAK